MSTWTSKSGSAGLILALALVAGCDVALAPGGASTAGKAITQAALAEGAVVVAMPFGYCIDPRSIRRDFAMAARCDLLGVDGPVAEGQAVAILTAATAAIARGATTPDPQTLAASIEDAQVLQKGMRDGFPMIQVAAQRAPVEGLSDRHWRTAFIAGGQIVALSLYAPLGSEALGPEGTFLLADAARATREATASRMPAAKAKTGD
jgi:hypothetical protein